MPSSPVFVALAAVAAAVLAVILGRGLFRDGKWEQRRWRRIDLLRRFPKGEELSFAVRIADALLRLQRDHARRHEAVEALIGGREYEEQRLRREIDRLAGKEVYHGQKEQL